MVASQRRHRLNKKGLLKFPTTKAINLEASASRYTFKWDEHLNASKSKDNPWGYNYLFMYSFNPLIATVLYMNSNIQIIYHHICIYRHITRIKVIFFYLNFHFYSRHAYLQATDECWISPETFQTLPIVCPCHSKDVGLAMLYRQTNMGVNHL